MLENPGRRRWLRSLSVVMAAVTFGTGRRAVAATKEPAILQPTAKTPRGFIKRAFDMRDLAEKNGDQGYGAIVVKNGRIVGQAPSRVVTNGDPSAHAEMEAIRDAARRLGTRDLRDCTMYSSSPPCPMCEAAAYWANVSRLQYGPGNTNGGAPRLSRC